MKKLVLLLSLAAFTCAANAQITLTGSNYTQNFDDIANGLPAGWSVYTAATSTDLGTDVSATKYTATPVLWNSTSGGFRNSASADGFPTYASAADTDQTNATNRALSIRQVGNTSSSFPGSDPGGAFVLEILNTNGLTNFNLSFELQSLDSTSARETTWSVDYGFGATPTTFTPANTITGTLTTGNHIYSNNTINVDFGNALDNQAGPIWIRIVTLSATTGSGSRTTTGIDNFDLTWATAPSYRPNITALNPVSGTSNVPVSTNMLAITFDRTIAKGTGNVYVTNETDNSTQTIDVTSSVVSVSGMVASINNISLTANKMYHVTFDSAAFDTASYVSYGIYDTTAWVFNTNVPVIADTLNETFDAACALGHLPDGWQQYSVTGNPTWHCNSSYGYQGTAGMQINGYVSGTGNTANEDWLITPELDFSAMLNPELDFKATKDFAGDDLSILVSHDYTGTGDPNAATWLPVNVDFSNADTVFHDFSGNINSFKAHPIYIAFKYISTTSDGSRWTVDNVNVIEGVGVAHTSKQSLPLTVLGYSTSNQIVLGYTTVKAGAYNLSIFDITGREVYSQQVNAQTGAQRLTISGLHLNSGMYIVKMGNAQNFGVAKAIIE